MFRRITSFYLFFLIINQPVLSNTIVDLIQSIRNKNADNKPSKDNLGMIYFLRFFFDNFFL